MSKQDFHDPSHLRLWFRRGVDEEISAVEDPADILAMFGCF